MQVSTDFIKWYLEQPSRMLTSLATLEKQERVIALQNAATKTTTALTGMPGGGGSDRNALLAQLADARKDWHLELEFVSQAKTERRTFIGLCPITDRQKQILLRRYVGGCTWREVAESLDITERQMYREHRTALERCAVFAENSDLDFIKEIINYDKKTDT